MARIFISYRRQNSPYVAAALKERLEGRFGEDTVFLDIDTIPFGADFRKHIDTAVGQCHAMLVLIGDHWLAQMERTGKSRLFDPRDYVRMEIEAALGRGIPIVPVLVEEADMPAAEDLPESIQELTFRNAAEVRAGRDFQSHMARLVDGLTSLLASESTATPARPVTNRKSPAKPAVAAKQVAKKATVAERAESKGSGSRTTQKGLSPPSAISGERRLDMAAVRREFTGEAGDTYIGSAIPPKKLRNALDTYASGAKARDVLVLYDGGTLWGPAKHGFLLTRTTIYWRNMRESADSLELRDLKTVTYSFDTMSVQLNRRGIVILGECASELLGLLMEFIKSHA